MSGYLRYSGLCEICKKARGIYDHRICSKVKHARGTIKPKPRGAKFTEEGAKFLTRFIEKIESHQPL